MASVGRFRRFQVSLTNHSVALTVSAVIALILTVLFWYFTSHDLSKYLEAFGIGIAEGVGIGLAIFLIERGGKYSIDFISVRRRRKRKPKAA